MASLKRKLGFTTLLLLTVNSIIGSGIFFLPALGARLAGPASLLAWLMMSVFSIFIAVYLSELTSMFPKAGGVYEYSKKAFGKFPSFLVGWTSWVAANITTAMLTVGAMKYIMPNASSAVIIAFCLGFIYLLNYISFRGIGFSSAILMIFAVITIIIPVSIIVPGLFHVSVSNLTPFFTSPLSAIFLVAFFISETFFGWESSTFLAEETKNPSKTIPKAIIGATIIVSIITLLLTFVSIGSMGSSGFANSENPISYVAGNILGHTGSVLASIGVFIVIIGAAAGWIVSLPRMLLAMSRDKMFIESLAFIHPKYKTPKNAILLQSLIVTIILLIGFGSYQTLLSLVIPLDLLVYASVLLGVTKLRYSHPKLKRKFKAPFGKTGPIICTLAIFALVGIWLTLEENSFAILTMGLLFVCLGIPSYAAVRLVYDKTFRERFFDSFSILWDKLFPIWYGEKEQQSIINILKLKQGDVVLDYGCYTGMTTKKLSDVVGSRGTVVAVDISRKGLELAQRKISDKDNVILIKEKEIIPFKKNTFDGITLVSVMDQFDDPERNLKVLYKILKPGKSISALSFGKVFYLPSPDHLESIDSVEKLFKKVGFRKIQIYRKMKLLSEYYFIKATK